MSVYRTAHRTITLTCDSCGQVFNNGIHSEVEQAREAAKSRRWSSKTAGGATEDYCSVCTIINSEGNWTPEELEELRG